MADSPQRERDMKLPRVEVGGRFYTKYDPNIALDIVERIAEGELLSKITAKDAVPITVTKQTFLKWVATVPELSKAYSAAMQISAHSFEEMAIDKAQTTAAMPGSPQNVSAASLLISQYRWSAARRNPTRYSDKGNTQIVVPVNISTTLDMGTGKQTADVEVPDIYTIKIDGRIEDGEFSELERQDEIKGVLPEAIDEIKKEEFRELLRPAALVDGTKRQPLFVKQHGKSGSPRGARKRVLTPRKPKDGIS